MKSILTVVVSLSIYNFAHANTQSVSCTGTARSGNAYKVSFEMDGANASYASENGIHRFGSQEIELEQFNSSGERVFHHIEEVNDFTAINPDADNVYSYLGSGGQKILIAGWGGPSQSLTLDVGRFRGIDLKNSNCTIEGSFAPVEGMLINGVDINDSVDHGRRTVEEARANADAAQARIDAYNAAQERLENQSVQ